MIHGLDPETSSDRARHVANLVAELFNVGAFVGVIVVVLVVAGAIVLLFTKKKRPDDEG